MRGNLILLICFCVFNLQAQTHFNQTMFFGTYGYNIKYSVPNNYVHDTMPNKMLAAFLRGTSSICNSNGKLLIISNGMNLFSGDGSAYIDEGDTLASPEWYNFNQGFDRYSQTCLILPFKQKKYYYVQVSMSDTQLYKALNVNNDVRMDRLYYNVIDMNMNAGQGKVVQRMKPLIDNKYLQRSCMQACKHANGKDWWVLKLGGDSMLGNIVYKFLFTQDSVYDMGIQTMAAPFKGDWGGQMQFNNEGNKWACSLSDNLAGEVFLADFNRCTGILNNMSKINVLPETDTPPLYNGADSVNLGICFSPNGNLLYISRANHIVQYNLQTNAQYMVYGPDTAFLFAEYVKLNLGPDDKVYIGHRNGYSQQMSTIDNPDIVGVGCNFCRKCLRTEGVYNYLYSMADMPNYDLGELQPCWPLGIAGTLAREENKIKVYPNPVNDILTVEYNLEERQTGTFVLYDITGKDMHTVSLSPLNNKIHVNIQQLAKGIYLYKYIKDGRVSDTGKMIIE